MTKIYVGDTGTELLLDTGQSLAGATTVSIKARKPDGVSVNWVGTVFETTKVRFLTLADSFDQAGLWSLQAKVIMPSGVWLGETVNVTVYKAFN